MKIQKTFNTARGTIEVVFNADKKEESAQIMICDSIGKDPWTGEGISVQDIRNAVEAVTPRGRELGFMVNSYGGLVNEGISIRNYLNEWPGRITSTIIGVAASAASWCIPADEVKAYKSSQMFIHRAVADVRISGNADDIQAGAAEAAKFLTASDTRISNIYADQTGKTPEEMLDLMAAETLLSGEQALELGMVDTLIDGEAKNSFNEDQINTMKQRLAALNAIRNSAAPKQGAANHNPTPQENQMKEKLALLNKRGITPPANATETQVDDLIRESNLGRTFNVSILKEWNVAFDETATDAQLVTLIKNGKPAAPVPAPVAGSLNADDKAMLEDLRNQVTENRRKEVRNRLQHLASSEGGMRIPVNDIENWEKQALACKDGPDGNAILNALAKLPEQQLGIPPVPENLTKIEVTNASIKDIARGFEAHDEATKAWQRGNNSISMETIRNNAVAKANFFKKFRNRFIEVMNTNTIAAELKRQVILQDVVIRDFVRRVISLNMFSTVFQNIPLQGLNTVEVPFYDLDTSASTSFVSGTGYTTIGNTTTDKREITVGEGAANGDRLYQALSFSSSEIARQPYLKVAELAGLKAEKLAFDIFQDILSIITAANYGAAAITSAAALFDSDKLADLKLACKAWPDMGRGLILDSAYDANLLKDPSFKHALNAASDSAIKDGRLFPRVMGFDYTENPNIPDNGENLVGFAVFKYAILVAFAPVPPVEEVRNAGTVWELVTDPATGISLEYRRFGNNVTDAATNVIESNYGFAKGLGTGLKRIVSA